ncbi:anti-phage deoxyguanosine triphosphatase [Plesiomonas shigelloides]|uniref:anti-phage deoxyguanosine triphosphatase n=1 Tax=Plesiomonas shigelloides TaxID=703 RepID=UPI0012623F1F|nr:anti-phage deoxyguanosine triphosphatase [Plesiomonas shigelloides]KAB7691564.1 dNTP triphosphohydrolase [Plesiomonas shigelloides]
MTSDTTALWQARYGEENKVRRDDHRSPYQRDRARILHSAAFRRLQAKTQVLGAGMNDFYRTRLTHSLEVAQIGTGIVAQLKRKYPQQKTLLAPDSLMECLCLAHDIGHPPFGHGGEVALNYMMRDHGGFEGNAQTFRIVTRLEPYTESHGMNLARRTLLGLLKYPALLSQTRATLQPPAVSDFRHLKASQWKPAKGVYDQDQRLFHWVLEPLTADDRRHLATMREPRSNASEPLKTRFKSLDCSVMELADDIAYGIHDLEDAIVMGIVTRAQWESAHQALSTVDDAWFQENMPSITEKLFCGEHHKRKDAIGALVNALITGITLQHEPLFSEPLLAWNAQLPAPLQQVISILVRFVNDFVVRKTEVQMLEYRGQQLIMELFDAFSADPERLLPPGTRQRWQQSRAEGHSGLRVITDYISGMTDGFAQRTYIQLFTPASTLSFDPHN